jgi:hypothetical protein
MSRSHATLYTFAVAAFLAAGHAAAVQRTFVASTGSDANTATNCGFVNPCRGFTAAMTVTDAGGEVVALDAAGYGAVTITKSITLTANPGFFAGIAASSGNAVTIATGGVEVTLRGLAINSVGATNGVVMTNGATLTVEKSIISNFPGNGIQIINGAEVRIVDTTFRNGTNGVVLSGGARATIAGSRFFGMDIAGVNVPGSTGTTTSATVTDSVAAGNWIAFSACSATGGTSRLAVTRSAMTNGHYGMTVEGCGGTTLGVVSNSVISGNSIGLFQSDGGVLKSLGNSTVDQNSSNTYGTITPASGI